jgi:3-hydroxyisobutyryl-CoA hydrolase
MASTTPEIPKELPGDEPDDVLFHSHYGVRLIELNRPKKLNSLNGSMARKILPRLLVNTCPVIPNTEKSDRKTTT